MDEATRAEVAAWLAKARRDLDSARRLLSGDPPYRDTAAYHCQQAAEKALKGLLAALAIPFPKTHDLTILVGLLEAHIENAERWKEAAIILTPYSTLFRYPDACPEPSDDDVAEALSMATSLVEEVGQKVRP
jgi:HEPN domain-containing protein